MSDPTDVRIESVPVDDLPRGRASPASVLATLVIAAASLGLLVHLQSEPLRLEPAALDEPSTAEPPIAESPASVPAAGVAVTTGIITAPVAVDADRIAVPDFTGLRLPVARRRARELGLRLVVRDPGGDAIQTWLAPRYRMRTQTVDVGTSVERGSLVRAVAADPMPLIVSGY